MSYEGEKRMSFLCGFVSLWLKNRRCLMAKFTATAIIHSIRGKLGKFVFSSWKGVPKIARTPKKRRSPCTQAQKRVSKAFYETNAKWRELSLVEKALWEEYTKKFRYRKNTVTYGGIIPTRKRTAMMGRNAYIGVNAMLMLAGFKAIKKPPLGNIGKPPPPSSDLIPYSQHKNGELKFKLWLSLHYPEKSVAQIWLRRVKDGTHPFVAEIIELSSTPKEVVISQIKGGERGRRIVEVDFKELKKCELDLQMRTIAQNGEFSMSTAVYRLEVIA